ncbi:hypothetical protein PABG_00406 [Paracoccidioides brasiliensis Pb03]|nr:hypothetical protein PABG_00406 [Paracoccidioides brasiliensis Pb03]
MSLHDCQLSEAHLIAFFASMEWDPSIPIDRIRFSPTETVWQMNPTSVSWQRRSHNDNLQTSSLYLSYSCEVFTHQTAFEGSLSDDTQLQTRNTGDFRNAGHRENIPAQTLGGKFTRGYEPLLTDYVPYSAKIILKLHIMSDIDGRQLDLTRAMHSFKLVLHSTIDSSDGVGCRPVPACVPPGQLSAIPKNLVVGLVRDKAATDARVEQELPGRNIHILQADVTDYDSLKVGLRKTAAQLSDSVDYLIANAALTSRWSRYRCPVRIPYPGFFLWNSLPTDYVGVGYSMEDPKRLEEDLIQHFRTNAVGNIHLLARGLRASFAEKGQPRKVSPLPLEWQTMILSLDMIAQYRKDGILFMALAPGMVDTGVFTDCEKLASSCPPRSLRPMRPNFKALTVDESISAMLSVIDRASIDNGYAGAFLSQRKYAMALDMNIVQSTMVTADTEAG